jgi:ethylbenzene dioxygenase beta subunit
MTNIDDHIRLEFEVREFLHRESNLLDAQRYKEWLDLLTDDIHYWAPAIESVEHKYRSSNYVASETEMAYFDDTRATLGMRVARLGFPGAWAEVPPSRSCHYITNILVEGEEDGDISVRSNFMMFRSRLESEEDSYYGMRSDILRRDGDSLKLHRRKITFAQSVLTSRSITTFF